MKVIRSIFFAALTSVWANSSAADLPKCPGSPATFGNQQYCYMPNWNNCVGRTKGRGINGIMYEGEWKNGRLNGYGKITHYIGFNKKNFFYEGTYKDCSLIKGRKKWLNSNSSTDNYSGEFKATNGWLLNPQFHGEGTLTYRDGQIKKGIFFNGKFSNKTIIDEADELKRAFSKRSLQLRKQIQSHLKALGYYSSSIDGLYGKNTASALRQYNSRHFGKLDLTITGNTHKLISEILEQRQALLNKPSHQQGASSQRSNKTTSTERCEKWYKGKLTGGKFWGTATKSETDYCVKKVGINFKSIYGDTPLSHAVAHETVTVETVSYLLSLGAKVNVKNNFNQTPLSRAAALTKTPEVIYLLVSAGALINTVADHGETALEKLKRNRFGLHKDKTVRAVLAGEIKPPTSATAEDNDYAEIPKDTEPKPTVENKETKDQAETILKRVASGTGFFISESGHIVTNHHVIDGCQKIKLHLKGEIFSTLTIASDARNDLALLRARVEPEFVFALSDKTSFPLQDVIVAGFPFGERVSSTLKFTKGIVSSLAGLGNNYSEIQIDAALQPGNSGGPIVDEYGNVIAVAVSKLDMKKILKDYGVIPENTNFGVKASVVSNLLAGNSVSSPTANTEVVSKADLSRAVTKGTVYLTCWMTPKQIEELKARKVMYADFDE